jgi:hypothetical protein
MNRLAGWYLQELRRGTLLLSAALVLFPCAAAAQTAVPVLPQVNGRVVAMRFFASYVDVPVRAARIYGTRFDSAATRYLNTEIELDFPAPGREVDFALLCTYTAPDGKELGPISLRYQVKASWAGAYGHAGWGSRSPGGFLKGSYRVRCSNEGTPVAEGRFEIVSVPPEFPAMQAKFTGIQFFESPQDMLASADRKYDYSFKASDTRYVGVELSFARPKSVPPGAMAVECAISDPDGATLAKLTIPFDPDTDWETFQNARHWGYDRPGQWAKGVYRVACTASGRWIADTAFEIF